MRINDSDMKILLAKQQQLQQQQQQQQGTGGASGAAGGVAGTSGTKTHVQIPAGAQGAANIAQLLAQGGNIQVHSGAGGTQVATIVKTTTASGTTQVVATGPVAGAQAAGTPAGTVTIPVSAAGGMNLPQVRAALARNPAQMQFIQRQILQRPATFKATTQGGTVNAANLTPQQKIALSQAAGKGMPQLIVSSTTGNAVAGAAQAVQKVQQSGVTVHQFQHIVNKPGQQGMPMQMLAAKAAGQPGQPVQARVIPVSASGAGQTVRPQQIQVVAAAPGQAVAAAVAAAARQAATAPGGSAPNVTVDASGRPAGNSHLANALASQIRIQGQPGQQQLINQTVSAIVGGQPVSVAVRGPAAASLLAAQQQGQAQKLQVVGATAAPASSAATAAASTSASPAPSESSTSTTSAAAAAAATPSTSNSNDSAKS